MSSDEVVDLLQAWNRGDQAALEKLIPLVDPELRRVADAYLRREPPGHELETTALINEAFIRLIEGPKREWQSRTHFFAVAARIMRQILVDYARSRLSSKRGGGSAKHVPLMEAAMLPTTEEKMDELLALDEALNRLAEVDERKSKLVEWRYFGGLTVTEIAEVLHLAPVTVEREWRYARAWLKRELVVVKPTQSNVSTTSHKAEIALSVTRDEERKLAEAWSNRELIATLMSENWAGLKLVVLLRLRANITKPELVSKLEIDPEIVNSLLLQLEAFGALEKQDDVFALSNGGHIVLENFETAIGNSFD
jgi:RNA polymerase sigma-70 factor, ECF subfamily